MKLIDKSALVAEIESLRCTTFTNFDEGVNATVQILLETLDILEVKEVDINKLCEFRKNIGFAYPEGASEYQKQLACYRQGIKDAIKAQKGEEI